MTGSKPIESRTGWLQQLVRLGGLGGTGVLTYFQPIVGCLALGSAILLGCVITFTALFGRRKRSERAFRLLQMLK